MTDVNLTNKIKENSIRFDKIYYVNWGLRTGTEKKTEKYVVETPQPNSYPMVRGYDILGRYKLADPSEYIIYDKNSLYNPMFEEFFENDKIIFRKISGKGLMAVVDEDDLYCFSTLIPSVNIQNVSQVDRPGIPEETEECKKYTNLYYALALVNSKLMAWYYKTNLSDNLSVVPKHIKQLPIAKISFEEEVKKELNFHDEGSVMSLEQISDLINNSRTKNNKLTYNLLARLAKEMSIANRDYLSKNLNLPDYLSSYSPGQTLADLYQPPKGLSSTILTETAEDRENLRVVSVSVRKEGSKLVLYVSARYKPEKPEEFETDRWGYTETEMMPAMEFVGLSEKQEALIEEFVPLAVDEAGGFADFRESATKTNSLIDRLEKLTLPNLGDVEDGLERYLEVKAEAEELDEKIRKTDDLIDQIVYELYGLSKEEIAVVEESVS